MMESCLAAGGFGRQGAAGEVAEREMVCTEEGR